MDSVYLLCLLILTSFSVASSAIVLPTTKHPQTHQHLTQLSHTQPITLVLDLNTPFLWLAPRLVNHTSIHRRSIQCSAVNFARSEPSDERCALTVQNPVTGDSALGELVQGVVGLTGTDDELLYVSAPGNLLTGLASPAKGVFGMGMNRVGVVEQVSHSYQLSKKFSLCLSSSSNGMILFGENDVNSVSKSMIYTPLLRGVGGYGYFVNVRSLKIQDKRVSLEDSLSTVEFNTVAPYTLMKSNLYNVFVKGFRAAAEGMKLIRVPSVGQFELCYVRKGLKSVPVIDLVLQSEMVIWRIHGEKSMVRMNDELMCLGVLDGGVELGASILLGSHQLEDSLLEFDLGSSMLGFSSLGNKGTSCAQLSASAMHKDVQSL